MIRQSGVGLICKWEELVDIAVLAWGSLIWNPGQLQIREAFCEGGPVLPIEFSRISKNGRLTLVIDEAHGQPCETYFTMSAYKKLDEARENLRVRENMEHVNGVGFVDLVSGEVSRRARERHPNALAVISHWAEHRNLDAVIWTALAGNFAEKLDAEYGTEQAVSYLESLPPDSFAIAAHYINRAPATVQTHLRAAFVERWPQIG